MPVLFGMRMGQEPIAMRIHTSGQAIGHRSTTGKKARIRARTDGAGDLYPGRLRGSGKTVKGLQESSVGRHRHLPWRTGLGEHPPVYHPHLPLGRLLPRDLDEIFDKQRGLRLRFQGVDRPRLTYADNPSLISGDTGTTGTLVDQGMMSGVLSATQDLLVRGTP